MLRYYWMLRAAAECFLESLPQCGLQVAIYLELRKEGGDENEGLGKVILASVCGSFVSACMHIKKINDGAKHMEAYNALYDDQEQSIALWLTGTDAKETPVCETHKGRRGRDLPMLREKGGKLYAFCPKRGERYCTVPRIHHAPYTMHYTTYTIHHTPYAICHTPYTQTLKHPYAICHTPHTIQHTAFTIPHVSTVLIRYTHTLQVQASRGADVHCKWWRALH
jgi:hypothetical protein